MPMLGCENLNTDDLKSVDKVQGGLCSVWNWLKKKDKSFDIRKNISDNKKAMVSAMIQKLSVEDLQELNAIDIQKLQNLNNSNNKKLPLINQMPNSLKKRKSVNNSKVDTNLVVTTSCTSTYSKQSQENRLHNNSPYVAGVMSNKSNVNNFTYKVCKDGITKIISQSTPTHRSYRTESKPTNIYQNTQQKEINPTSYKQIKAHRFSKSNHTRQDSLNNNKTEDRKNITKELNKNKSMDDTEIKLNSAFKLNELKISPAVHNLNNKNSPIYNETQKYVSCKIYSTNKKLSKSIRKAHRKITKKNDKHFRNFSSEKLSKTGYPFENFKDSLNSFSLDFSASLSIEPIYDKTKYFKTFPLSMTPPETILNKNPLGGYGNSSITIEINGITFKSKDSNSHSAVVNSTTNQEETITKHEHEIQKPQNSYLNLTLCNNASVPSSVGTNINELNTNNLSVFQSNDCLDTKRCATEIFVGKDSLKSDDDSSKTNGQIKNKPISKNLSLEFNKQNIQSCEVFDNDSCKGIISDKKLDKTQSCEVFDNASCKGIVIAEKLENQNINVSKESKMPLPEEKKKSQIKITILVEDDLKKVVDLRSNVAVNNKECLHTKQFSNTDTRSMQKAVANRNESVLKKKEDYTMSNSCYPLLTVNNKSTVKTCLEPKNQGIINKIENNCINVMTLNTPKPKNYIEDNILWFGNEGRYLYMKERKQLELRWNKQNTNGVNDLLAKTNISNKNVVFHNDNNMIFNEPNSGEIKESRDFDDGTPETEVRVDNNLTNSSKINTTFENNANESIKNIPTNPLLLHTDNEIKTINSVKTQQDLNDGKMEERQDFRFKDKKDYENNLADKCIFKDTRKRSYRYSLTLSQEPTCEESEDGMSTKDFIYIEHQSDKGDNIEIKSTDCMGHNTQEITTYEKDITSPISAWLNRNDSRSDNEHVQCKKNSSILVQTDWSLIGKSFYCLNEIPKYTVACQTDSIMNNTVFIDKQITNGSDSCEYLKNDSDSCKYLVNDDCKLVSHDTITIDREESINTPPNNQINLSTTTTEQNGMFSTSNVFGTIEAKHQCTARYFYSASQESSITSASQLDCTKPTTLQDNNFYLSKTEASVYCGSTSSDHVSEISTIEEGIGSSDNHMYDKFCEGAIEKMKPDDKKIEVNSNKSKDCKNMSTFFVVGITSDTNKTNMNASHTKLDLFRPTPKQRKRRVNNIQEQGKDKINTSSDTVKIEQNFTSTVCCVDCKSLAAFNLTYCSD